MASGEFPERAAARKGRVATAMLSTAKEDGPPGSAVAVPARDVPGACAAHVRPGTRSGARAHKLRVAVKDSSVQQGSATRVNGRPIAIWQLIIVFASRHRSGCAAHSHKPSKSTVSQPPQTRKAQNGKAPPATVLGSATPVSTTHGTGSGKLHYRALASGGGGDVELLGDAE